MRLLIRTEQDSVENYWKCLKMMRNLTGLDICFNRNHGNDEFGANTSCEMDQLIALDISFYSIDNNRIKIISGMKNLDKIEMLC